VRKSLRTRELVSGAGIPHLSDEVVALVGTTVVNEKNGLVYFDEETKLSVRFVHEAGMYLFKGEIEK